MGMIRNGRERDMIQRKTTKSNSEGPETGVRGGSPYITPLSRPVVLDREKFVSGFCRELVMECPDQVIGLQVVPGDPLVVGVIVSDPLYQVLDPPVPHSRVQDPLYLVVILPVNDHRVRRRTELPRGEGVGRDREQLDNREDRMKPTHRLW